MPACLICNTYTLDSSTVACSNCGWLFYLNRQLDVPTFEKLKDWAIKSYMKSPQKVVIQESPQPGVQLPHVPGMGSKVELQAEIEKVIGDLLLQEVEKLKTSMSAKIGSLEEKILLLQEIQTLQELRHRKKCEEILAEVDRKLETLELIISRQIEKAREDTDAQVQEKINVMYNKVLNGVKETRSDLEEYTTSISTRISTLETTTVKVTDIQQIKLDLEKYISFKLQGTSISTNTFTSTPRSGSSTMPPTIAQPTSNNAHESQTNRAAFNLVEEYNKTSDRIPESITNKATYVGMDRDQLASRRDVNYPPVLSAKPSGNFLVVVIADTSYLVPNKKVYFDEYAYKIAVALYDCQGYSEHYTRIELIRPALVSKTADNEWTLLYKGILKFI